MYSLALLHLTALLQELEIAELFWRDDFRLVQSVHVELGVGVVESFSHNDFTFEKRVGSNFATVEPQSVDVSRVLAVTQTEQSDAVLLQNGILC